MELRIRRRLLSRASLSKPPFRLMSNVFLDLSVSAPRLMERREKTGVAFETDSEAVSPVISTILMVALTIVLGATIFYLVSDSGENPAEAAAAVGWRADETTDRLVVVSTVEGADWKNLAVRISSCTQPADSGSVGYVGTNEATPNGKLFNEEATASGGALNQAAATGTACGAGITVVVSEASGPVKASDFLDFCATPGPVTNVVIEVQDTFANARLHQAVFNDWPVCA